MGLPIDDSTRAKVASTGPTSGRAVRRRRWPRRLLIVFLVGFVVYTLFGFFGVPLIIRKIIVPNLSDDLNGEITLASASANPFTWRVVLDDVVVVDGGGREVASVERIDANLQLLATVFRSGTHLKSCTLTRPRCHVAIEPDLGLNLANLFVTSEAAGEPMREVPRIVVGHVELDEATLTFRDATAPRPVETALNDVSFVIEHLDTAPAHDNTHTLHATLADGATLEWTGSFFADPLTSRGTIDLTGLDLAPFTPYLALLTPAQVHGTTATATLTYAFAPLASPRIARIENLSFELTDVVVEMDDQQVVSAPIIELANVTVDAARRAVTVGLVRADSATLHARRESATEWQFMRAMPQHMQVQAADGALAGTRTSATPDDLRDRMIASIAEIVTDALHNPWSLRIDEVVLESCIAIASGAGLADDTLTFHDASISAGPLASDDGFATPFELSTAMGDGRSVQLDGVVEPLAGKIDAHIETIAFPLHPSTYYLPFELRRLWPNLNVLTGDFTTDGRLTCMGLGTPSLTVWWQGTAEVASLEVSGFEETGSSLSGEHIALDGAVECDAVDGVGQVIWGGSINITNAKLQAMFEQLHTIEAGDARLAGEARLALPIEDTPDLLFDGELDAAHVLVDFPDIHQLSGGIAESHFEALTLKLPENHITSRSLTLREPNVSLIVHIPTPTGETEPAQSDTEDGASPVARDAPLITLPITAAVDHVDIAGGTVRIEDNAREHPVALNLHDVAITAVNVNTEDAAPTEITIGATVEQSGRVTFAGQFALFAPHTTAEGVFDLSSVAIVPYDPIVSMYVGHHIDEGRATVRVPFTLDDRLIAGEIDFVFDRLYLGDSVQSPIAPNVPMKLGLSLLRDADDRVIGTVPFDGDLSDPNFSYTGLVWRAILNLIIKAATSPFQLLGSLFGEGEEDLSQLAFEPGSAEFSERELGKLDTLARALTERPELTLVVEGRASPEIDHVGLWRDALRASIFSLAREFDPEITSIDMMADRTYRTLVQYQYALMLRARGEEAASDVTFDTMEAALAEALGAGDVPVESYRALAGARAEHVAALLVEEAGIDADRVIVEHVADAHLNDESPRVVLTIR